MKRVVSLYATHSELYDQLNERAAAYAAERGIAYEWLPQEKWTVESAVAALEGADAGIIDVETYDSRVFDRIKDRCKLLVRYGVGFDAVNLADATAAGITVARTAGANAESVAEMSLTMMLAAKRQLPHNRKVIESGVWERSIGGELFGKKVGILGFGAIGKKLAKLLSGFEADVYVYDPFLPDGVAESFGAHKEELDRIFSECDAISVNSPYTPETHHLVDARRIALMKPDAVVVCTSRGNIVDEDALADALRTHRILGAGLDVFAQEPLPLDSPLIGLDNVILTPHESAQTTDALWNIYARAIEICSDFFAGKELARADFLNPDVNKTA